MFVYFDTTSHFPKHNNHPYLFFSISIKHVRDSEANECYQKKKKKVKYNTHQWKKFT